MCDICLLNLPHLIKNCCTSMNRFYVLAEWSLLFCIKAELWNSFSNVLTESFYCQHTVDI